MGANTSDADLLDGLGRGRGRGRGRGSSLLVKQNPNDAGSVVWSDFYFDAPIGGAYTLTAAAGSYSLSGVSANLLKSKRLTANAGSYALNGVTAGVYRAYKIAANAGAYSYTGVAAIVAYTPTANNYVLTANVGIYALTGVSSNVLKSKRVVSNAGVYALSGVTAGVVKSKRVVANNGVYALSGSAAGLTKSKRLSADAGAYALAGNAANIVYAPSAVAYTLTANAGSYTVSGKDAGLNYVGITPPSFNGGFVMRSRKVYVKRGKQYLIFNNNEEADAYLAAENAIETAKKSSRGAAKRVIKALKVVKPEIAPEPKLEELSDLLAKFEVKYDLIQLQKNNDIDAIYHIQSMLYALQQDEEDIELLLLAI